MSKRKTEIDKAIDGIDHDIAALEGQLAVLRAARVRLTVQQQESATSKVKRIEHGHTEGGRGI
jgi:hypothetical protein